MSEQVPIHRIEIPNAKPVEHQAASIVIEAIRRAGLDPGKVALNPMGRQLALAWRDGELDLAGFTRAIKNLAILNPSLRA